MKDFQKYMMLWDKKEEFSLEEIKFLKSYIKRQNFKVSYGFYNKESSKKMQIALIIDLIPNQLRRTGVENNWEVITTRSITDKEIEEFINHYFRNSYKRFLVFYYKNIDRLIYDDKMLDAVTPE
jgi:isochorismate hydrolase